MNMETMFDQETQWRVSTAVQDAARYWQECTTEPSVLYKPAISIDGDKWCALYGANLQDGVAGFGDSPFEAMVAFNKAWFAKLPDLKG